jgi:hypothetical protein
MHDDRSIRVLFYTAANGERGASVLVEQLLTYVKMVGEGVHARPKEVSEIIFWPAAEDPGLEKHLTGDDWMSSPPLFDELFEKYRACECSLSERIVVDGKPSWKNDGGDRWSVLYPGKGYPLPDYAPSEEIAEIHRSYIRAFDRPGLRRHYGPDFGKQSYPTVFQRGLPTIHCATWDAPESPLVRPERREIIVLQGEGDLVTILLCGYARVGQSDYFEMFVPTKEMKASELGETDVRILERIERLAKHYGAERAKWIVKHPGGDWLTGVVVDGVKPELLPEHSPSPADLPLTLKTVREFLDWRTVAYQQEIRLLGRNVEGLRMSGFEPVKKSRH